jgi:hypothetical protein
MGLVRTALDGGINFVDVYFLPLAVSRFGCGKPSVIKQTLEMQSEDTSATKDPLKEACLARGVCVNPRSKAF